MTPILPGATSQSVYFKALDNTTGLAVTTLTSATTGLVITYKRTPTGAATTISLSDLAAENSAWSSGGMKHVAGGVYRLCIPDAAVPAAEGDVTIIAGVATAYQIFGCELVGKPVEVVSASLVTAIWAAVTDSPGVTTLLSRLTATRAGYLDNLSAGAVATASALASLVTTVGGLVAAVWAYATRTLTQSAASVTAAVTGSDITVYRGTRWTIPLTGLPSNTGYTAILFSVKAKTSDSDALSKVLVRKNSSGLNDGLIYFDGVSSVTANQAAIAINSATAITITVEAATTQYATTEIYEYGIKYLDASGVPTQASIGGTFKIVGDNPRAIT